MNNVLVTAVFLAVCSTTLAAPIGAAAAANLSQCLLAQHQPHHMELVQYQPISGISSRLGRTELNTFYTAMLELWQSVGFLQSKLGCRVGQPIPPPHHHCFLQERDAQTFQYNSTELFMHRQRLAADLCILVPFENPLRKAICYEETSHAGVYAFELRDIQRRFSAILETLSNITGVPLSTAEPSTADSEVEEATLHPDASSPSVSGRNTRQADNHITPPPVTTNFPGSQSDSDILNQQNFPRRRRQSRAATCVEATEDRCSFPQSDMDQFIYIYELFQAIWYTVNDLKIMAQGQ